MILDCCMKTFASKNDAKVFLCNKFAKFTSPFMKQIKRYCRKRQKGLVYETADKLMEQNCR